MLLHLRALGKDNSILSQSCRCIWEGEWTPPTFPSRVNEWWSSRLKQPQPHMLLWQSSLLLRWTRQWGSESGTGTDWPNPLCEINIKHSPSRGGWSDTTARNERRGIREDYLTQTTTWRDQFLLQLPEIWSRRTWGTSMAHGSSLVCLESISYSRTGNIKWVSYEWWRVGHK